MAAVVLLAVACSGWRVPDPQAQAPAEPTGVTTAVTPTPTPLPSTVRWKPCGDPFECATLKVPRAHGKPGGKQLRLALIRLPAPPAARRIGSLVVNPGGPGQSGVGFVRHAAVDVIPAELRARFDVVGFDPRGVGASTRVRCKQPLEALLGHNLDPDTDAEVAVLLAAAEGFADACARHSGDLLSHVSTTAAARDLDLLRAALGDRQLSYVGFSYGTFLGARYAELFPDRVRALVLDGAVDPRLDVVGRAAGKAANAEQALTAFLRACRNDDTCRDGRRAITRASVDELLARLRTDPLPAPMVGPEERLRAGHALVAMSSLLAEKGAPWELLAQALLAAQAGDGSLLLMVAKGALGLGDPQAASWLDPLLAINCADLPAPAPVDLPTLAERLSAESPRFGAMELYLTATCAYWSEPPRRMPAPIHAPGTPPLLVIGTTGDGVTPYDWSVALAAQLDTGVLLTRDGVQHTAFGGRNVCTDRAVIAYLIDGATPPEGSTCG